MEWNSENIRLLRLRMGWSQSDLARRLACEWQFVHEWEEGLGQPPREAAQNLELLFHQAELATMEMIQSTQAEILLEERELESIDTGRLETEG